MPPLRPRENRGQTVNWPLVPVVDNAGSIVIRRPQRPPLALSDHIGRLGSWPLRLAWLVVPLTTGAVLEEAAAPRSAAVTWSVAGLAWGAWALGLLAAFVAHPLALSTLRLVAPSVVGVALGSTIVAQPSAGRAAAGLVTAVVAAGLALDPALGDRCVDGASYGSERRLALRVPTSLLWGPLPLAWLGTVLGLSGGPLLLAARQWVLGGMATVVGGAVAAVALRAVHGLSGRMIVLVPAGLVLHDRAALTDPVLFTRDTIAFVGPALAGDAAQAADLTLGATGLALELRLTRPLPLPLRRGRKRAGTATQHATQDPTETVSAVLFSPLRPGHLLSQAQAHGLPVA